MNERWLLPSDWVHTVIDDTGVVHRWSSPLQAVGCGLSMHRVPHFGWENRRMITCFLCLVQTTERLYR